MPPARLFVLEDELHAEWISRWPTFADARAEVERLATVPWDEKPNRCPCISWRTCRRRYCITELDTTRTPWRRVKETFVLDIGSRGVTWHGE